MTLAIALALLALWLRPRRFGPAATTSTGDDLETLATLVALGLNAGMSPARAIASAARFAHPELAQEALTLGRQARLAGLSSALRSADGSSAPLFHTIARAAETGAPMADALRSFADRMRAEARLAAQVRMRRLPVKLVFPLALLMLPGLVLMVSGPALIEVLGRFA